MSTTTTNNATTTQLHQVLDDYNIRFTGSSTDPVAEPQATSPEVRVENPQNWPNDYRDVPAYRPINHHLDMNERPGGINPIERLFIFTMLHGVWLNASISKSWRVTGGRLNDRIFRYKIGGEW